MIPVVAQLVLLVIELAGAALRKARSVIGRLLWENRPGPQVRTDHNIHVNGAALQQQLAATKDRDFGPYFARTLADGHVAVVPEISSFNDKLEETIDSLGLVGHVAVLIVHHWPDVTPDVPDPFVPERWACGGCDFVGPSRAEFTMHVAQRIDALYTAQDRVTQQLRRQSPTIQPKGTRL